jgi:hypothetical protein
MESLVWIYRVYAFVEINAGEILCIHMFSENFLIRRLKALGWYIADKHSLNLKYMMHQERGS